jgi:hypothetical protein
MIAFAAPLNSRVYESQGSHNISTLKKWVLDLNTVDLTCFLHVF